MNLQPHLPETYPAFLKWRDEDNYQTYLAKLTSEELAEEMTLLSQLVNQLDYFDRSIIGRAQTLMLELARRSSHTENKAQELTSMAYWLQEKWWKCL